MAYDRGVLLKPRDIAKLCYNAKWIDAQKLLEAVSVVLAESNGYTRRRGPEHDGTYGNIDGSYDRGLWQINSKAHPSMSDAECDDPVIATKYARMLYEERGNSFRPWAAYLNGSYRGPHAMGYAFDGVANFLRLKNGFNIP